MHNILCEKCVCEQSVKIHNVYAESDIHAIPLLRYVVINYAFHTHTLTVEVDPISARAICATQFKKKEKKKQIKNR